MAIMTERFALFAGSCLLAACASKTPEPPPAPVYVVPPVTQIFLRLSSQPAVMLSMPNAVGNAKVTIGMGRLAEFANLDGTVSRLDCDEMAEKLGLVLSQHQQTFSPHMRVSQIRQIENYQLGMKLARCPVVDA